jgi:hypothetical protein
MKVCGFHSIAVEIVVNIFTFISFQDIFYNKMPSVSYELHNTLNCLIKNIKQENCLKINSLNSLILSMLIVKPAAIHITSAPHIKK